MPLRSNLPSSASVATPDAAGKLFAPSAARNVAPLMETLRDLLPSKGQALEIASGTGQHIVALAEAFPAISWQPSEIDPTRRTSIEAYVAEANLPNVTRPRELDATTPGWAAEISPQDVILLSNLLHLISTSEAQTLVSEAAQALAPKGLLLIYGPFKRGDRLVSPGDEKFDADLRAKDPQIGYKSDQRVTTWGVNCGLSAQDAVEMPANNLLLCWSKPT